MSMKKKKVDDSTLSGARSTADTAQLFEEQGFGGFGVLERMIERLAELAE